MGLFKKNKTMSYSQDHLEKTNKLIKSAHTYAIATYIPLLDKYPELEAVANSNLLTFWGYLTTIACVGTAFMEIADTVPEKDQPEIAYAVQKKLNDWQSDSYNVMVDFAKYVKRLVDSGVEVPDAIGGWIWVNLEKHDQSNQKLKELASTLKLVRVLGYPF